MKKLDWNRDWQVSRQGPMLEGFQAPRDNPTVNLPHDAMITERRTPGSPNGPDAAWFNGGTYVYTKYLEPSAEWRHKAVLLELEGVCQNAMVFVNGQFAGKCPYAYTGFHVNIGKYLIFGRPNEVKVTAKTGMQQTSRWYSGGGILRPAWLLVGGCVHIAPNGVRISTPICGAELAVVSVCAEITHTELGNCGLQIETTLIAPDGTQAAKDLQPLTLFDQETVSAACKLDISSPSLWGTETPSLYTAIIRVLDGTQIIDEQSTPFGIRSVTVSRTNGMLINGAAVKLRGACIHHDNGILGGIAMNDAELRRVRRLKAAGFNAIRSAHNPASKALLKACDEVGMLVMDELFDVWNNGKREHDYSLSFAEWWRLDMEAVVAKDFNHPSVVIYTVGNEIPETGTPGGAAQNRAMTAYFRGLDPTRPIANCVNGMFSVMPRMREILAEVMGGKVEIPGDINALMTMFDAHIDEIMRHEVVSAATEETFAGVDLCGYNYMHSRYVPDGARYPNRLILGSETTPGKIGYNWPLIRGLNYVLGDFCWTGWDYIGEAGVGKNDYELTHSMYGPWPWYLAYCGDFDLCGDRRPQSFYREIVYGLRARPYVCVERPERYLQEKCTTNWTWPDVLESWTWPGFEGKHTHVEVYSDADEVELLINGALVCCAKVGEAMPYKAIFDVEYQPGTLTAVAKTNGIESGSMTLATAGAPQAATLIAERSSAPADGMSLIYLNLSLTDGEGKLNPNAQASITLQVEGPAALAGFGSADPQSTEGFGADTHATFDGRALAVLRTTGSPGVIRVTASAEGLNSTSVTLKTEAIDDV